MRHHNHPETVAGAATYYAEGRAVVMKCTDGYHSVVSTHHTPEKASTAAMRWQVKENDAVVKEANKLAKSS